MAFPTRDQPDEAGEGATHLEDEEPALGSGRARPQAQVDRSYSDEAAVIVSVAASVQPGSGPCWRALRIDWSDRYRVLSRPDCSSSAVLLAANSYQSLLQTVHPC